MRLIYLFSMTLLLSPALSARDFYVDPLNGSAAGDGSAANPWRTLQEVNEANLFETQVWSTLPFDGDESLEPLNPGAPIQAGDTLILKSGHHGQLTLNGAINQSTITLRADVGATPTLSEVSFRGARHWRLIGVEVSPSFGNETPQNIVQILDHPFWGPSSHVQIEECDIYSQSDSSSWTAPQWVAAPNGIFTSGDDLVLLNNTVTNTRFGIQVLGERGHVKGNTVRNFSGDGLRGLGDDGVFEYNYVANNYAVDDNHDDGFQSWSLDEQGRVGLGEVRGIVLRGNIVINREDNNQNFAGPLQGLVCFDGFARDWVIENNIVVVDHYHGISLSGSHNALIINNTIIDMVGGEPGPSWISVIAHKDGRPSTGNIVRNNLVPVLANEGGVSEDNNLLYENANELFVNPTWPWDLHLIEGAAAIDVGNGEGIPAVDGDGAPRVVGDAVDIGAYEYGAEVPTFDAGPLPPDAAQNGDDVVQGVDVNVVDSVVVNDAGQSDGLDAGPLVDGAIRRSDEPTPGDLIQECGCSATSGHRRPSGQALGLAALVGLLVLTRRRR